MGLRSSVKLRHHGESISLPKSRVISPVAGSVTSFTFEGAELGPQVPLIQVFTPKRGSTHAWRTNQTTRMPRG